MTRRRDPTITSEELLRRALAALGPYRETVVLVGGFARDLYRRVPGSLNLQFPSSPTNDVDFAVSDPLRICGSENLHGLLLQQGLQYKPQFGLDHRSVNARYYPSEITAPNLAHPHVEFITPLRGPDREVPVSRPQRDELYASPLRYVDLLLEDPIQVVDPVHGRLLIPHPLHYILQKNLIRPKRTEERKQAKDQADAYFVLTHLQAAWPVWADRWRNLAAQQERSAWLARVLRQWDDLYVPPRTAGAREIVGAYPGQTIAAVCSIMAAFRVALGVLPKNSSS